jgi:predicted GNAT family acetyltransferase
MKLITDEKNSEKFTIIALVNNKAGVLARVSGLFARRGFNIDSLAVGPTENAELSRMIIVVNGDEYIASQVTKQLAKLVDTKKIIILETEKNRVVGKDGGGNEVAWITFPETGKNTVIIDHTFVDDSLRGQGIAGNLIDLAYDTIKESGRKAVPSCAYAVSWFQNNPDKTDIVK